MSRFSSFKFLLAITTIICCVFAEPENWTWRGTPYRSTIKNQGGCGSCWARASASAVDDLFCIASAGEYCPTASAQYSIQCDSSYFGGVTNNGCWGGHPTAYGVHMTEFGVVHEECMPYLGKDPGECPAYCVDGKTRVLDADRLWAKSWNRVSSTDSKRTIFETGPLAIQFRVYNDFYSASKYDPDEIYMDPGPDAKYAFGHALVIVGYGVTDDGVEFYEVANSWGTKFHDEGYAKIRKGTCGSESYMVLFNVDVERAGYDSKLPSVSVNKDVVLRGGNLIVSWSNIAGNSVRVNLTLDSEVAYESPCGANDGIESITVPSSIFGGDYVVEVVSYDSSNCTGDVKRMATEDVTILPPSLASFVTLGFKGPVESGTTVRLSAVVEGALPNEPFSCDLKLLRNGSLVKVLQTVSVRYTTDINATIPYTSASGTYSFKCDLNTSLADSVSSHASPTFEVTGPPPLDYAISVEEPIAGAKYEQGESLVSEAVINDENAVPYLTVNIDVLHSVTKDVEFNVTKYRPASSVTKTVRVTKSIPDDVPDGEYIVRFSSSYSSAVFKYSPVFTIGDPTTTTPDDIYFTAPSSGTTIDPCTDESLVVSGKIVSSSSVSSRIVTIRCYVDGSVLASITAVSNSTGSFSAVLDTEPLCLPSDNNTFPATLTASVSSMNIDTDPLQLSVLAKEPDVVVPISLRNLEITSGLTGTGTTKSANVDSVLGIRVTIDGYQSGVTSSLTKLNFSLSCPKTSTDSAFVLTNLSGTVPVTSSSLLLTGTKGMAIDAPRAATNCTLSVGLSCGGNDECGTTTKLLSPEFNLTFGNTNIDFINPSSGEHLHEYYSLVDIDIRVHHAMKSFELFLVGPDELSNPTSINITDITKNTGSTIGIDFQIPSDLDEGTYFIELHSTDPNIPGFVYKYTDGYIVINSVSLQDIVEFQETPSSLHVIDDPIHATFLVQTTHPAVEFPIEASTWLVIEGNTVLVQKCMMGATSECFVDNRTIHDIVGTVSRSTVTCRLMLTSPVVPGQVWSPSISLRHPIIPGGGDEPQILFPDDTYTVSRGISMSIYVDQAHLLDDIISLNVIDLSDNDVIKSSKLENTGFFEVRLSYLFKGPFTIEISDDIHTLRTPALVASSTYESGTFIGLNEDGSTVLSANKPHLFEWRLHDHARSPNVAIILENMSSGEKSTLFACTPNDDSETITTPSVPGTYRLRLESRTSLCNTMYIPDTVSPTFTVGTVSPPDPNEPMKPSLEAAVVDKVNGEVGAQILHVYGEDAMFHLNFFSGEEENKISNMRTKVFPISFVMRRNNKTTLERELLASEVTIKNETNDTLEIEAEIRLNEPDFATAGGVYTIEVFASNLKNTFHDIIDVFDITKLFSVTSTPSSVVGGGSIDVPIVFHSSPVTPLALDIYTVDATGDQYCQQVITDTPLPNQTVIYDCDSENFDRLGAHHVIIYDTHNFVELYRSPAINVYEIAPASFKFSSPASSRTLMMEEEVSVSFGFATSTTEKDIDFRDSVSSITFNLVLCDIVNPTIVRSLEVYVPGLGEDPSTANFRKHDFNFMFNSHDAAGCYRIQADVSVARTATHFFYYTPPITYDTTKDIYNIDAPKSVEVDSDFELDIVILDSAYATEPIRVELYKGNTRLAVLEDALVPPSYSPTVKLNINSSIFSGEKLPVTATLRVYALVEPIDTLVEHTLSIESGAASIISIDSQSIESAKWGERLWIYFTVTDPSIFSMACWLVDEDGRFIYNLLGNTKPSYRETELVLPSAHVTGNATGYYRVRLFSTTGTSAEAFSLPIFIGENASTLTGVGATSMIILGGSVTIIASVLLGGLYAKRLIASKAMTSG